MHVEEDSPPEWAIEIWRHHRLLPIIFNVFNGWWFIFAALLLYAAQQPADAK
jgi:hypothetical protein